MRWKLGFLAFVAAVGLAAVATSATGAQKLDPGVTAKTIVIGGTFPFTGVAAVYGAIPKAERAYFLYVNAHGGVNGRRIQFVTYDDAYDPSKTVPLTQKLVEQNKVFADYGSLGTAPVLAVRPYLNGKKVPQVLVATGDSYWGTAYKKYPWTIGWQPDYPGEAQIYAKFILAKVPQAKIGWAPIEFINNVSSAEVFLSIAAKSGANIEGAISTDYVLDPNNADQAALPGTKLATQILNTYGGGATIFNLNNIYGLASGWTMVQALKAAGNPPTRAGLMKALTSLNTRANPFLYKGIAEKTSPTDWFPVEQQILVRYHSGGPAGIGYGEPFGRLYNNAH